MKKVIGILVFILLLILVIGILWVFVFRSDGNTSEERMVNNDSAEEVISTETGEQNDTSEEINTSDTGSLKPDKNNEIGDTASVEDSEGDDSEAGRLTPDSNSDNDDAGNEATDGSLSTPTILSSLESLLGKTHKVTKFNGEEHEVHAVIAGTKVVFPYHPTNDAYNTNRCYQEPSTPVDITSDEVVVKPHPLLQVKETSLPNNSYIRAFMTAYDGAEMILNIELITDEGAICTDLVLPEFHADNHGLVSAGTTEPGCPAGFAYNKNYFAKCPSIDQLYDEINSRLDGKLTKLEKGLGILLKK